jgi:single-strand DNA-binding protein
MGSLNMVQLIGNLGADPELKYTPSQRAVCNMRLATSMTWKDKSGAKQEKTEWHRVTVWGEMGEACSKYLAKGSSCYVQGRLETSMYEKDGQKHYSTNVVAERVTFLHTPDGARNGGGGGGGRSGQRQAPASGPPPQDDGPPDDNGPSGTDDDIPF